jgi:hypothetical protein
MRRSCCFDGQCIHCRERRAERRETTLSVKGAKAARTLGLSTNEILEIQLKDRFTAPGLAPRRAW